MAVEVNGWLGVGVGVWGGITIRHLISLWWPSTCHSELGPATRYMRRRLLGASRLAAPSGSTRSRDALSRSRCTTTPCCCSNHDTSICSPERGCTSAKALTKTSRSPSQMPSCLRKSQLAHLRLMVRMLTHRSSAICCWVCPPSTLRRRSSSSMSAAGGIAKRRMGLGRGREREGAWRGMREWCFCLQWGHPRRGEGAAPCPGRGGVGEGEQRLQKGA